VNYLLDTCVLSEFIKPQPSKKLFQWLDRADDRRLAISVLSIGEIQKGISRMPTGKRQSALMQWLNQDLIRRFNGRILAIELDDALLWGQLTGEAVAKGETLPATDAMLASTAICRGLTMVTRNVKDFVRMPLRILNPWE
jgi:predicted nucleic acid-binding protein